MFCNLENDLCFKNRQLELKQMLAHSNHKQLHALLTLSIDLPFICVMLC